MIVKIRLTSVTIYRINARKMIAKIVFKEKTIIILYAELLTAIFASGTPVGERCNFRFVRCKLLPQRFNLRVLKINNCILSNKI